MILQDYKHIYWGGGTGTVVQPVVSIPVPVESWQKPGKQTDKTKILERAMALIVLYKGSKGKLSVNYR